MKLREFKGSDFPQLIEWINSDELNYLWGGPTYTFPLTVEQIHTHCGQDEIFAYMLDGDGEPAGFVELYKITETHYRICRVFIADAYRGKGLSKSMLNLLIDKARLDYSATKLSLAVFAHNRIARKSYESLGFQSVETEIGSRWVADTRWDLIRMEKQL
jgi:RimJ/RimL family protein N-acetyltransferase